MSESDYTFTPILKIETDTLRATTVHSLVLYDFDNDNMLSFADQPDYQPVCDGIELALLADGLIIHSDYPIKTIERLFGVAFDRSKIIDTLVLTERSYGKGGNKLAHWAAKLGMQRPVYKGSPTWNPWIQEHCQIDACIIAAILRKLGDLP